MRYLTTGVLLLINLALMFAVGLLIFVEVEWSYQNGRKLCLIGEKTGAFSCLSDMKVNR